MTDLATLHQRWLADPAYRKALEANERAFEQERQRIAERISRQASAGQASSDTDDANQKPW